MPDVALIVGERRYEGWESVRVTRSMETVAGSFEVTANDRWAEQVEPWPLAEEDRCRVEIGTTPIIDGYIDRRTVSLDANARTLNYAGRDRAAVLVDCTALLGRYRFYDIDPVAFITEVAKGLGVEVVTAPGLGRLDRIRKQTFSPGDTAWQAIQEVASAAGVLVISDGAGRLQVTRGTTQVQAAPLRQGDNIRTAAVEYDGAERYHRYVVASTAPADDDENGEQVRILVEAFDEGVRRQERVLMLRPEKTKSRQRALALGAWEARVRAARAEALTVSVVGWTQPDGTVWPINALCAVNAPAVGVVGTLLISQATYELSSGGQTTTMRLVRPDAFEPAPRVRNPSKRPLAATTPPAPAGPARIQENPWKGAAGSASGLRK